MLEKLLADIGAAYPLEAVPGSERTFRASVLKFNARACKADGLGNVSIMTASGLLGLMRIETLIVNPFDVDAPIFSYDRIHAMGREILEVEMFDSLLGTSFPTDGLAAIAQACPNLKKDKALWYDSLMLSPSLYIKGRRKDATAFDRMSEHFFRAYIAATQRAEPCDPARKREKAMVYSEGLLTHGGPATDPVKKAMGEAWTAALFREVLFGTGRP